MTTLIHAPGCNTHCGGKCNPVDVSIVKGPVVLPVTEQHDEPVEVTQADREAAAAYWKVSRIGNNETLRRYRAGEADNSFIVQAFARHRLATRPTPSSDMVEAMARAICTARGLSPDSLYQHHKWEDWPVDKREEYADLRGEKRVNLMHYGWRKWVPAAQAAATVATEAMAAKDAMLRAFVEANPPLTNAALRSELAAKDAGNGWSEGLAKRIADVITDNDGIGAWRSCTGCHETNEGYPTGGYPYVDVFQCEAGGGCRECGGIGVVWDGNDYADYAEFALAPDAKDAQLAELRAEVEALRGELTRLKAGQWFYLAGDMSSDRCRFSPSEVIDEDWLYDNRAEGSAVVQMEVATPLPDIWCAVRFFTNEEKDARQSDDDYELTEHASEADARAALGSAEG